MVCRRHTHTHTLVYTRTLKDAHTTHTDTSSTQAAHTQTHARSCRAPLTRSSKGCVKEEGRGWEEEEEEECCPLVSMQLGVWEGLVWLQAMAIKVWGLQEGRAWGA